MTAMTFVARFSGRPCTAARRERRGRARADRHTAAVLRPVGAVCVDPRPGSPLGGVGLPLRLPGVLTGVVVAVALVWTVRTGIPAPRRFIEIVRNTCAVACADLRRRRASPGELAAIGKRDGHVFVSGCPRRSFSAGVVFHGCHTSTPCALQGCAPPGAWPGTPFDERLTLSRRTSMRGTARTVATVAGISAAALLAAACGGGESGDAANTTAGGKTGGSITVRGCNPENPLIPATPPRPVAETFWTPRPRSWCTTTRRRRLPRTTSRSPSPPRTTRPSPSSWSRATSSTTAPRSRRRTSSTPGTTPPTARTRSPPATSWSPSRASATCSARTTSARRSRRPTSSPA